MVTRTKIALGVGALLLLAWYVRRGTAASELDGIVTLSSLVWQGKTCVRVDLMSTGRARNTAVDASECCDDNPAAGQCASSSASPDASGLDGAAAFVPSLPPKTSDGGA